MLDEGGEIPRVPEHLGEALEALEEDEVVRSALPGRLYDVYMHYKRDEWEQFLAAVTDWEREKYLDVCRSSQCAESRGSSTGNGTARTPSATT